MHTLILNSDFYFHFILWRHTGLHFAKLWFTEVELSFTEAELWFTEATLT